MPAADGDDAVRALVARLQRLGFGEANVARWFAAPLVSDVRYLPLPSPVERPRRGLGALIALFVGGEAVAAAAVQAALGTLDLAALAAAGVVRVVDDWAHAELALVPLGGLVLGSSRRDHGGADAVGAPDLSALNLVGCLPARAEGLRALDIGCGAGAAALVLARRGARAAGSDVDAAAVALARRNADWNDLAARFVVADLFAAADAVGDGAGGWDLVTFNAPLVRAPLAASDPTAAPRYLTSPEGEALVTRFLDGLAAYLAPGGEAVLHAQLTPAVEQALDAWAARAQVLTLRFAHALDGTPHALTAIRAGAAPGRRSAFVPLGPLCPCLGRAILDGLGGARVLAGDVTPLAAPWLELRESRQVGGGWRARSFGGVAIDEAEAALLARLTGPSLAALGLDDEDQARLARLVERGHVLLR